MSEGENKLNWEVVNSIYVAEEKSTSKGLGIYQKELKQAVKSCKELENILGKSRNEDFGKNAQAEHANTVIGILGDRGSGKTSFLYSLKNVLESDASNGIYPLDIIDPTNFDTNLKALEVFLASLYVQTRKINARFNKKVAVQDYPRLGKKLEAVSGILANLRREDEVRKENPNVEILEYMADITNIRNSLHDLCEEFLNFTNKANGTNNKCIAVLFDDIDLASNKTIFSFVQDIRKFLSGNVIVVFSCRERQLIESLEGKELKDEKALLKNGLITKEDIRSRVQDMLEKLIPSYRRIRLLNQIDLLSSKILDALEVVADDKEDLSKELINPYKKYDQSSFNSEMSVKDWISSIVLLKTKIRLVPFNRNEETAFMWPRNLRELIPLAKLLQDELKIVEQTNGNFYEDIRDNLARFDLYFKTIVRRNLNERMNSDFNKWDLADYEVKNFVAYASMMTQLNDIQTIREGATEPYGSNLLNIAITRPDNVVLGDISNIANLLAGVALDNEVLRFYCYAFKITYSIELLRLVLSVIISRQKGDAETANVCLMNYLALINRCPITPEIGSTGFSLSVSKPSEAQVDDFLEHYQQFGDAFTLEDPDQTLPRAAKSFLEEIDGFLNEFGCTIYPINGGVISRSRPILKDGTSLNLLNASNRRLFSLQDSYREEITKDADDIEASAWRAGGTYWVSSLYTLGKRDFIETQLDAAEDNMSFYLLYSLFDIDVFCNMIVNQKKGAHLTFSKQLERLGFAISIASTEAKTQSDNNSDGSYADRNIVKRKDELSSYGNICAPFATKGSIHLVDSEEKRLAEIDLMFELIDQITDVERKTLMAIDEFVTNRPRDEIKEFVEILYQWAVRSKVDIATQESLDQVRTIFRDGKRLMPPTRSRLRHVVDSWPNVSIAAYKEYRNAQRR